MNFYLRKALPSDCRDVYLLSNEPSVRANSINKSEIEWSQHISWFETKLKDARTRFYVVCSEDGEFLGQVRFGLRGVKAVVSISLNQKVRGKGISHEILSRSCRDLFQECKEVCEVEAFIWPANAPSIRGFERAGFKFLKSEILDGSPINLYILNRVQMPKL